MTVTGPQAECTRPLKEPRACTKASNASYSDCCTSASAPRTHRAARRLPEPARCDGSRHTVAVSLTGVTRVLLHIGAPKSGSSYLQGLLAQSRPRLRSAGVLYPGDRLNHFAAVPALTGRSFGKLQRGPAVRAWRALLNEIDGWTGTAVLSSEMFAWAEGDQVRRIAKDLGDGLEVVYVVRDFSRVLPAAYQETVKHRNTATFETFLETVAARPAEPDWAVNFWAGQDAGTVLRRWVDVLSGHRVHVVTIAPMDRRALLQRFAGLVGADAAVLGEHDPYANPSLMDTETEVLRQVNVRLPDELAGPGRPYGRFVRAVLANEVLGRRTRDPELDRPLRLSRRWHEWAAEQADRIVEEIAASGAQVTGELDEIRPPAFTGADPPGEPARVGVLAAACDGLAGYLQRGPAMLPPLDRGEEAAGRGPAAGAGRGPGGPGDEGAASSATDLRRRARAVGAIAASRLPAVVPSRRRGRVLLHVGVPGAGGLRVPETLQLHRSRLAEAGVRSPESLRPRVDVLRNDQEWHALLGAIRGFAGTTVVSSETFAGAENAVARSRLRELERTAQRVEAVFLVPPFAEAVVFGWQQALRFGGDLSLADFCERLARPDAAADATAKRFWRMQGAGALVQRWAKRLPPGRVHVVIAAHADRAMTWRRLAEVAGVPADVAGRVPPLSRRPLSMEEARLLRLVNRRLDSGFPAAAYGRFVRETLTGQLIPERPGDGGTPPGLPEAYRPWVEEHARRIRALVTQSGATVVGDPDKLLHHGPDPLPEVPAPDDEGVLAAALDGLADWIAYVAEAKAALEHSTTEG